MLHAFYHILGLCMFNYVFYMRSSLPLLHTAVPTPCLNAFWHSDPYIFLHFLGNVFLPCLKYVVHALDRLPLHIHSYHLSHVHAHTDTATMRRSLIYMHTTQIVKDCVIGTILCTSVCFEQFLPAGAGAVKPAGSIVTLQFSYLCVCVCVPVYVPCCTCA